MKYRTIVADPPWEYPEGFATAPTSPHKQDRERGASNAVPVLTKPVPYPTLSVSEICALPVARMADSAARLFLWTTNRHLSSGLEVVVAWGFQYKQLLVWDKRPNVPPFGGSVAKNSCEFLVVATKGRPPVLSKLESAVIQARRARTTHSRKPDVFLDLVETVSPGPYLELFARRQRLGWDTWGNEALEHIEMGAA